MPKPKILKQFFRKKKAQPLPVRASTVEKRQSSVQRPSLGSTTIVCDLGSAWTRLGFANSRAPPVQIPSLVGRQPADDQNNFFMWSEAAENNSTAFKPVKNGRITDLNAATFMLDGGLRRLGALTPQKEDLSGRNLLLALRPSEDQSLKERLFQSLMETYRPDGCFFALQQPLALYACARSTGLVLDSGEGVTHAVPVMDGQPVLEAVETVDVGGDDVTDTLLAYLTQWDFRVRTPKDRDAANRIKEGVAYVAPVPGRAPADRASRGFQLPDGRIASLKDERYLCAEPLFNPDLLGRGGGQGMAAALVSAVGKCPAAVQGEMAQNIFPFGGNSRLKGFDERLEAEMKRRYAGNVVVRRPQASARQTACWSGGAAWARTPAFADTMVTRAEYQEEGIRAFQRKC